MNHAEYYVAWLDKLLLDIYIYDINISDINISDINISDINISDINIQGFKLVHKDPFWKNKIEMFQIKGQLLFILQARILTVALESKYTLDRFAN